MSKTTKVFKSTEQIIAEMEIERLYQKALSSSDGLSLEDTKKFDILVKTLREAQKENQSELETKYNELRQKMVESLPSEALIKYIEEPNEEVQSSDNKEAESSAEVDSTVDDSE